MLADVFETVLPEVSSYRINDLGKDAGVVFSADVKSDARLLWSLPELLSTERTYITASTFFGRRRQRRYVRHVLAIVCDFDTESDTTYGDILDRYHAAHLPTPDLIVSTATVGHYQAWSVFDDPLRVRNDLVMAKLIKVHDSMAHALGADQNAVGVERWVRRPNAENTVYIDDFSRTSWDELCAWWESYYAPIVSAAPAKVIFIGTLLSTPAGQRIQEPAAEHGFRNEWAYGLGLCLYDAGVPAEAIHSTLITWNKAIEEPLPASNIETIFRSVMSGHHHASPRVLEALTGRSARIKGWYKWAKPRDRRRDHLSEVKQDIISDLFRCVEVSETQKAWAERLGIAFRTLKLALAQLREESIIDATTGHGRYAESSYKLSEAYLATMLSSMTVAGESDRQFSGTLIGHTANSPLMGTSAGSPGFPSSLIGSPDNKVRAG